MVMLLTSDCCMSSSYCWYCCFCTDLLCLVFFFFFFKQKTAYEMRISDWSSDVCSSDLCQPTKSSMAKSFHRGKASFRHLPCHTATIGASPPKQAGGASRRKRLTCILPCVVFVLCSKTGTELPAPALQGESLFTGDPSPE